MGDETITQAEPRVMTLEEMDAELEAEKRAGVFGPATAALMAEIGRRWIAAEERADAAEKRAEEARTEATNTEYESRALSAMHSRACEERDQARADLDRLQSLVDAARAVREAHAAVGGDEGIKRAAPELVEACALVSSLASTHGNPWVREVWTATCALTAAALEDPTCAT